MAKTKWYIKREGYNSEVVRRYNWVTKMYSFIIRNPHMFKNKKLYFYEDETCLGEINYSIIQQRVSVGLRERKERNFLRDFGRYQKEMLK